LLGHVQPATTQRYAHLDADPLRKASERIADHLATAMGEPIAPPAEVTDLAQAKQSKDRRTR
jgi:hypothetical protein